MPTPAKAQPSGSDAAPRARAAAPGNSPRTSIAAGKSGKIKVLVVDDSALIRRGLSVMLGDADDIEVIGAAKDGVEAQALIQSLKPDVVTLDIEMPRMTGLELLDKLASAQHRPAVLMVSSATKSHAPQTVRALELGASDFVFKQANANATDLVQIKDTLIAKVRAVWRHRGSAANFRGLPRTALPSQLPRNRTHRIDLVVIGASAGGPTTLAHVFELLKRELKGVPSTELQASVLVVQHMPAQFTTPMAARFGELCGLPVRVAETGDTLEKGCCLVAPGGRNLFLNDKGRVQLAAVTDTPGEYPKIDLALVTAAEIFGSHLCGIIMTGMGRDGTEGLCHARKLRAATYIQEPATCVVDGMPSAALQAQAAELRLTPDQIAQVLAHILLHARVPSLESAAQTRIKGSSGSRRAFDSGT